MPLLKDIITGVFWLFVLSEYLIQGSRQVKEFLGCMIRKKAIHYFMCLLTGSPSLRVILVKKSKRQKFFALTIALVLLRVSP